MTQISASHFDNDTAFASVSRFRIDDLHPYIYRTRDGGKTWQKIVAGLPDAGPVDTVREDPVAKGLLFAGTENAVWVSFDAGDHWQSLQLNLPHTSMRDLWIHNDDLLVGTHGRSFWVLDDITPLRQLAAAANAAVFLFKPASAYRVRRDTNYGHAPASRRACGPESSRRRGDRLRSRRGVTGPVTLEILDAAGKRIRHYSSDDKPPFTLESLRETLTVPTYWVRMPATLSNAPGMHRFVWDLHETPPHSSGYSYPISAIPHDTPREPLGPSVLPGQYTVRLTAGGKTFSAPIKVIMDPRVTTPAAGLRQQHEIENHLAEMMNESFVAQAEVRGLDKQLDALSKQANGAVADAVAALHKKVSALAGGQGGFFAPPSHEATLSRVSGELGQLYGQVGGADATPTATQTAAFAVVEKEHAGVMARWKAIKSTDVPALNRQLTGAGLTVIELKAEPEPASESEDEE